MTPQRAILSSARRRGAAVTLSLAVFVTACAGSDAAPTTAATVAEPAPIEAQLAPTTAPIDEPSEPVAAQPPQAEQAVVEGSEPVAEAPIEVPESTTPPAPAAVTVALPAVDVVNLANGETTDLNNLAQPGATLLWFWAPH